MRTPLLMPSDRQADADSWQRTDQQWAHLLRERDDARVQRDALLTACKELREALAALMRANVQHETTGAATRAWTQGLGHMAGFGVRANAAIARAEGKK